MGMENVNLSNGFFEIFMATLDKFASHKKIYSRGNNMSFMKK